MTLQQSADYWEEKAIKLLDHASALEELVMVEQDKAIKECLLDAISVLQGASSHAYSEHLIKQGQANLEWTFNL